MKGYRIDDAMKNEVPKNVTSQADTDADSHHAASLLQSERRPNTHRMPRPCHAQR